LGCNPIRHPGSLGLVSGYPSREVFERCFEDPDVFMIHKVGMEMDSPDRQIARSSGRSVTDANPTSTP
jgi:hypothetical protein